LKEQVLGRWAVAPITELGIAELSGGEAMEEYVHERLTHFLNFFPRDPATRIVPHFRGPALEFGHELVFGQFLKLVRRSQALDQPVREASPVRFGKLQGFAQ
jgi:hypothetical protein